MYNYFIFGIFNCVISVVQIFFDCHGLTSPMIVTVKVATHLLVHNYHTSYCIFDYWLITPSVDIHNGHQKSYRLQSLVY